MSVDELIDAARTFTDRISEHRHEFVKLADGQHPTTLFISCSDSRVIPAMITNARPGQLFELRTAGAIIPGYCAEVPCAVTATIEFALAELGIRHIVMCGHSHCAAVGALCSSSSGTAGPAIARWLRQPHLRAFTDDGDPSLSRHVQQHVLAQLAALRGHPHVRALTESGELRIDGWYYEVHSGTISAYDDDRDVFRPL
jgi:carbonic anhydrase